MPSCAVALRSSCAIVGADCWSIRAPLWCRPGCHLGCRLKRYLSSVSSTFVCCLERYSCAISKAISGAAFSAVGKRLACRPKHYLKELFIRHFVVVSGVVSARYQHHIGRCFEHCPYVVPFAFAASPVSPLAPPLALSLAPSLASCLAPLRLSRCLSGVFERVVNK